MPPILRFDLRITDFVAFPRQSEKALASILQSGEMKMPFKIPYVKELLKFSAKVRGMYAISPHNLTFFLTIFFYTKKILHPFFRYVAILHNIPISVQKI
jgi:hypothetical protein